MEQAPVPTQLLWVDARLSDLTRELAETEDEDEAARIYRLRDSWLGTRRALQLGEGVIS